MKSAFLFPKSPEWLGTHRIAMECPLDWRSPAKIWPRYGLLKPLNVGGVAKQNNP